MQKSALEVGVDVPWVTSWTAEEIGGVRPCASVGGRPAAWQADRPGYGKPQYSKNHLVRQRWSVRRMLCPMCGQPTEAGDRWTQVAQLHPVGLLRATGRGAGLPGQLKDEQLVQDAGSIAPLHKACVDRSLMHCPHLKADPHVNVMPFPERWIVLPLLVEARDDRPGHALMARPRAPMAVVMFLQLCGLTDAVEPKWRKLLRAA